MLSQIIRLQVVVEIITNKTASALELLARQQIQMCATIYQNHLALDYLLAEEGRVCGKFSHSDCCLQIDDSVHEVTNIATNVKKLPTSSYKLGMGGNLMIGLAAGSHGFSISWDPLLLLELSCALVHDSLTFLCVSFLLA
jgi:hypothetical protein